MLLIYLNPLAVIYFASLRTGKSHNPCVTVESCAPPTLHCASPDCGGLKGRNSIHIRREGERQQRMWLLSTLHPQLRTDADGGGCLQLADLSCPHEALFPILLGSIRPHSSHYLVRCLSREDTEPPTHL